MTALDQWTPQIVEAPTFQRIESPQEIAIRQLGEWAHSADAAYGIAQKLVLTSFCPESFRNKAGEATAAILAGMEVGLQPMAALRSFDVISGQAAPRAITLRALVQSFGHEMVLEESTGTRCRMRGRRKGSTEWQSISWTMDRARQLGLANKPNWTKQPQAMLLARATSELARIIAADAILGLGYSAEEVADGSTYEAQVAQDTTAAEPAASGTGTRRMSRQRPTEPHDEPAPAETAEPTPITEAQSRKMFALYHEAGIEDRAERMADAASVVGRDITSSAELTKAEAVRLIDDLERRAQDKSDGDLFGGAE